MKKPSRSVVSANKPNRGIKSIEPKHFGRGRPTKYKPEYVQFAKQLAKLGATDAGLADAFQVRISTIRLWMNNYPEFSEAIKVEKAAANQRVERSLYERANGYNYEAVKVFMPAGSKYLISDHPMTIEQWAAERATVVNEVIDDSVTLAVPVGIEQRKKGL
jgi:hypothetical protein